MLEPPRPIAQSDQVASFDSGNEILDDWLRKRALSSEGRTARTYVAVSGEAVAAYFSLAAGGVRRDQMLPKAARNVPDPVPVILIGRLAVDRQFQGRGIGAMLLKDALRRTAAAAEIAGVRAVMVHAIDDAASRFYARLGFQEFPNGSRTMYLPIETIRAVIAM